MKHSRPVSLLFLLVIGGLLAMTTGGLLVSGTVPPPPFPMALLQQEVPFDFNLAAEPDPQDDPLDVVWMLIMDADGHPIDQQWQVLDGSMRQLVCDDFHTLYVLCDGPACLNLLVIRVDGVTGATLDQHQCYVRIE